MLSRPLESVVEKLNIQAQDTNKGLNANKKGRVAKKRLKSEVDAEEEDDLDDEDDNEDEDEEDDDDEGQGPRRGRRGKKPPTIATPTSRNANFDCRKIIMQWLLSKELVTDPDKVTPVQDEITDTVAEVRLERQDII
jgi:hypothetical protein